MDGGVAVEEARLLSQSERLSSILDRLAAVGQVQVDELVASMGISAATARRDLDSLAQRRLVTRTRGGAVAGAVSYDLPTRYSHDARLDEKLTIAEIASDLVSVGDVVGLSGGTTCTHIAKTLSAREDLNEPGDQVTLTVVTNAINIAAQLAVRKNFQVMVPGGMVNRLSYELVGEFAEPVLNNVALDIAFIGVNGIEPGLGGTVKDAAEARMNALLASRAKRAYVVADTAKLGERYFARIDARFAGWIREDGVRKLP